MDKKKKQFRQYALANLVEAVHKVEHEGMSMSKAARTYGVPRSTLKDKVHGRSAVGAPHGSKPYLTPAEESRLEQWAFKQVFNDNKAISKQILEMAHKMIQAKGNSYTIRNVNGKPGNAWFARFMQRHPSLRQHCHNARKKKPLLSRETLDKWFLDLQEFVKVHDCGAVLMSAERMWSVDGVVFSLGEGGKFVKAMNRAENRCLSSNTGQITMLQAISAGGSICPPALCYPGKELPTDCQSKTPDFWFSLLSKHGSVTPDAFLQWLEKHFYPFLQKSGTTFPVLLLISGDTCYIDDTVCNICTAKRIILYKFPVNSSHILQPFDLTISKVLEEAYKQAEKEWLEHNPGLGVTKDLFPHVLFNAWENILGKSDMAQHGFAAAGLFPFDGSYNRESVTPLVPCTTQNPHVPSTWEEGTSTGAAEQDATVQSVAVEESACPSQPSQSTPRIAGTYQRGWGRKRENGNISTPSPSKQQLVENGDKNKGMTKDVCNAKKQLRQAQRAVMHLMKDVRQAKKVYHEAEAKEMMAKEELCRAEVAAGKATAELTTARKKLHEMKLTQRALQVDVQIARKNLQKLEAAKMSQQEEAEAITASEAEEIVCTKCDLPFHEDDNEDEWIDCSSCPRMFHVQCTDLYNLTPERIAKMEYMCPFCKYG